VIVAASAAAEKLSGQIRTVKPMHVGKGIGSLEDAERFKALSPVPAIILPME